MTAIPIPKRLSVGHLAGWACVVCNGLADDHAIQVGTRRGRPVFACADCHRDASGQAPCGACGTTVDAAELAPDHNGDEACGDCRSTWSGLDDAAAWRRWTYAA